MTVETLPIESADAASIMERVVIAGDLAKLSPEDRVLYYAEVCRSVGLNPLTRPFDYIVLNGRLTLYANKGAGDQLRKIAGVSITKVESALVEDVYTVTVYGTDKTGRIDSEMGAVPVRGLQGEARANAYMKALTKAKRRLTLSLVGLGMLDETEVASIPDATPGDVDTDTGEIRQTRTEQVRGRLEARAAERTEPSMAREDFMRLQKERGVTIAQLEEVARTTFPGIASMAYTTRHWGVLADKLGLSRDMSDEMAEAIYPDDIGAK